MPALADLFKTCYLTGGSGVEFSAIRLHYRGVDEICRAFGATALTVGTDIYFRREAFAPHTPGGLRLLAHEVAHVVQQHRRPVTAGPAEEREADAAADALLRGRRFDFGGAGFPVAPSGPDRCVVQRYMAPATRLAEIPAAASAGRDRRGPGGRCAGAALRVRAVEAVFLCRRA
jgi:hypothetical protein